MTAQEFNSKHPVGSTFDYRAIKSMSEGDPVKTRSAAWKLGDGEVVVMLDGKVGGYSVEHLTAT